MKLYIYVIHFPTSNKYYIGLTQNLNGRMIRHLRTDSLVGRALNKYNDWTIEILHTCRIRDEANKIEIEEIRHYNCVVPNGYNITRGGEGTSGFEGYWKGKKRNEETRKKISKAAKELHNRPEIKKKTSEFIKERNKGNKFMQGKKNPNAHSAQSEIKRLRTRLARLEPES